MVGISGRLYSWKKISIWSLAHPQGIDVLPANSHGRPVKRRERGLVGSKNQKQQSAQRFFNATASAEVIRHIITVFLFNQCLSFYFIKKNVSLL